MLTIFCVQGSDKVKKLHGAVATEAQKYIASMFEVHREVQQLRNNLREQHRIWIDFYSTVFGVSHTGCSISCMVQLLMTLVSCSSHWPQTTWATALYDAEYCYAPNSCAAVCHCVYACLAVYRTSACLSCPASCAQLGCISTLCNVQTKNADCLMHGAHVRSLL